MITANIVARAIVAACRETGEEPIAMVEGRSLGRARHYAMHALAHCFPEAQRSILARVVGCKRNPASFFVTSLTKIQAKNMPWWDEVAYARVINAVERERWDQWPKPPRRIVVPADPVDQAVGPVFDCGSFGRFCRRQED